MTAEAEVGPEARAIGAVVELTEAGKAKSEVGLEARAAESVVEAGVEAGINTLPVEAENEAGSGAMNTSSLRSAEALSTPAPEPVEEYIEDAKDSEGGSSNNVFMSIFLQSGVSRHPSHPTQPPPGSQRSPGRWTPRSSSSETFPGHQVASLDSDTSPSTGLPPGPRAHGTAPHSI